MAEPIRVAFNASAVPSRPGGAGVYTLELARALARRSDVELLMGAPNGTWSEPAWQTPAGLFKRTMWEQMRLPPLMKEAEVDVYHGPHFSLPLKSPVPRVATVHDLTFYRIPRRYDRVHRWYYRGLARMAGRAERVIVPSSAVAGDVVGFLGYPVERIRVIPEAPRRGWAAATPEAVSEIRERLGIAGRYVLMVGTSEPGKRAIDGVRALARLQASECDISLVLAGNAGSLQGALMREVGRLGLEQRVIFAGFVEDDALRALYTGAVALLFLSLYEGFGLPPLEAMACGTPVIAAKRPAMDDVLRNGAVFVDAGDSEAVAKAIRGLLNHDARFQGAERGLEHVRQFSWERAAEETCGVYREIIR